ncbi:hypothetical protein NEIELOOT_01566 [Neisseria elongata subsp. glycolytica ATCC 29315]|uniref:Uncharacterized protein n=1 Tax=Neisseria elongata subsp. glycolytica ATCC 29315 TaxID=546263 RepID=D4DR73_NEIEG|nr:hypothetical protein NEIELOOT_01566 [Neisseria elongata subsp. glycolytica ATCC 29315]
MGLNRKLSFCNQYDCINQRYGITYGNYLFLNSFAFFNLTQYFLTCLNPSSGRLKTHRNIFRRPDEKSKKRSLPKYRRQIPRPARYAV